MSNWTLNGEVTNRLSIEDRGTQYGDGLFETVAIRSGEPRFWELHMARLALGCERLAIDAPSATALHDELNRVLDLNTVDPAFAVAKIIVTAGQGPRGYRRPSGMTSTVAVGVFPSRPRPVEAYRDGVAVTVCQTRLAQQPQFAGIKTLNRLEQVIAQSEQQVADVADGLMLDTDDRLICGTMSNVFVVNEKTVVAPAITRCGVAGTMRRKVMELVDTNAMDFEVRDVPVDELNDCDEIFLSNSQFGVLPVTKCGKRRLPVGATTRRVMQLLADAGVLECRL